MMRALDQPPLIAVHGFMYDPGDKGGSNDPVSFFDEMSGICGRPVVGFPWYSAPFGLRLARPIQSVYQTARAWIGAWLNGRLQPYEYAWKLSSRAANDLVIKVLNTPGPVDLLGHSLGTRVVLQALLQLPPGKVRRVVLFNGAEHCGNACWVADNLFTQKPWPRILNVAVRTDDVLRVLGANFSGAGHAPCIGQAGLASAPAPVWSDVFVDDAWTKARALELRGWTIRGDAPDDVLDHGYSYRFAGNCDLVRAFLAGDDLADLVRPRPGAKAAA